MKSTLAKVLTVAPFVLVGFAILLLAFGTLNAEPTADEIARQARELRIKAMKGHCGIIGAKVAECYAGDKKTCSSLQESIAWFTSEYGQTPEIACTVDDPLRFGGGHQ